jgi:outer membrane receptor protein involved in Fe transport
MSSRQRLLASTIVAGAAALAVPAFAQTTDQTAPAAAIGGSTAAAPAAVSSNGAGDTGGEIIVTGSRIPQPGLTSTSPITVVTAQDLKLQGTARIEDLLNSLPQVFADLGGFSNNPSDGTADINLRNLGSQRTLVLVNGHRLQAGDPKTDSGADINMIPDIMVKRIDVLTGGASSVYGSDAVSGVVNFVTDNNFTGVSVDSQYSLYPHTNGNKEAKALLADGGVNDPSGLTVDGRTFTTEAKIGAATDDGRGHVVAYFGYRKIQGVNQGQRDYSACALNEDNSLALGAACGGSAVAAPAYVIANGTNNSYQVGPGSTLGPFSKYYNYAPSNYFQRNDKRYQAGFFANYDVSDGFKPYAQFMFMDDESHNQVAPGGSFGENATPINCDNPLLSAQELSIICGPGNTIVGSDGVTRGNITLYRRNVEGGPRVSDFRHTDYHAVLGAKGDLAKGLSYDASYQYGDVQLHEADTGYFSNSKLANALDVITDPTTGQLVCRSGATGCAPYNPWTGSTTIQPNATLGVTQDALDYLEVPSFTTGETKEQIANASVTFLGDEYGIKSPWSNHGVGLNVGGEYRKESLSVVADSLAASGDLSGFGSATPAISGSYNVKEIFAEVQIPLISDKPFFKELSLEGGYRYSHYNLSGGVSSYKAAAEWAISSDLRIRGGYNRAVRAPNVAELFGVRQVALDGATDPCAGLLSKGQTPSFTQAQCANLGVSAAQYGNIITNPANQYNGLIGGPTDPASLKPEKADTYTVGFVLTPRMLPGFNLQVDAYRIKISGLISSYGADNILQQCGQSGAANFCDLVHRDAAGSLWQSQSGYVIDTTTNAGTLMTQGIDVATSYTYRTENFGSIGFSINGTYLDKYKVHNFESTPYDCAGSYGPVCGTPIPHWRHKARVTWTTPSNLSLSAQWRYIGKTKVDQFNCDINASCDVAGNVNDFGDHIKAYSYFDLTATARVADKLTLRLGTTNIFDKDPPILGSAYSPAGSFGGGNTFPQVYDVLGRYVFAGVTLDL